MSKSKRTGSAYERETKDYLNMAIDGAAPELYRIEGGMSPMGDLFGWEEWTIECKNDAGISLGEAMNEVKLEQARAVTPFHLLIQRRRNSPRSRDYVIMEQEQLARLINVGVLLVR